ncbi:hypothetical protein TorRG33x02_234970, partial [Trema orientale]
LIHILNHFELKMNNLLLSIMEQSKGIKNIILTTIKNMKRKTQFRMSYRKPNTPIWLILKTKRENEGIQIPSFSTIFRVTKQTETNRMRNDERGFERKRHTHSQGSRLDKRWHQQWQSEKCCWFYSSAVVP